MRFLNVIRGSLIPLLFLLLIFILLLRNYTPGTYLTGWDNLHPEFNFALNFQRALFAAWQEYQGLGLLGGMGHAADLTRVAFLYLVSFVIPSDLNRYFYHFLMLYLGVLGVYFLLKNVILDHHLNHKIKVGGAIIGALFYLLNLGTIQYFYVPFEPFSTFWAFFPWEIYVLLRFLNKPNKYRLLALALVNFLAIPQAYLQTLFLVYVLCVGLILAVYTFKEYTRHKLFLSIKIFIVIFLINAFWLLPNAFFVLTDVSVTQNAFQNQLVTDKTFQQNKSRGDIFDFALLRQMYFDLAFYDQNTNQVSYLMPVWRDHFKSIPVVLFGYILFGIVLFGLLQRAKYNYFLLAIFGVSAVIFLSDFPPFSFINSIFRSIPIVNQIFRNPFTKFIVPTIFVFSLGFTLGVIRILETLDKRKFKINNHFVFGLVAILLFIYVYPVFRGNLTAPIVRVAIPEEYFDLFSYFDKQQKNERIMNLPQGSFWGWNFYNFGARGSGFIWYGIEQPIMDRAFDVWSPTLEGYYWELSYALKKRDKDLFNQILEKYQIGYVLLDGNIIFDTGYGSLKTINNQEDLLKNNGALSQVARLGKIVVYKTKFATGSSNYTKLQDNLPKVTPSEVYMTEDKAFEKLGTYLSSKTKVDYAFPFGSLFTGRFQNEHNFKVKEENNNFIVTGDVPAGSYNMFLPSYLNEELVFPVLLQARQDEQSVYIKIVANFPTLALGKTKLSPEQPFKEYKISKDNLKSSNLILSFNNKDFYKLSNLKAEYQKVGESYILNSNEANYFRLYSQDEAKVKTLNVNKFQAAVECGTKRGQVLNRNFVKGSEVVLQAKNTAICTDYEDDFTDLGSSLIEVSQSYKSLSDEYPQFCFYSFSAKNCLNRKDEIRRGFSLNGSKFLDFFENIYSVGDTVKFSLILDASGNEDLNKAKEIKYSNLQISAFPYLLQQGISVSDFNTQAYTGNVEVASDATFTAIIPKIESYYSLDNAVKANIYKTTPLSSNGASNASGQLQTEGNSIRVTSQYVSSNFVIKNNYLDGGLGYLAKINSRNLSGFPLVINIFTNKDSQGYVYTFSERKRSFTPNYFVLPPIYQFDRGINVLLENNSYNRSSTVNEVNEVSLYPFPYNFLTSIYLQNKGYEDTKPASKPVTTRKINPSLYQVKTGVSHGGTLILSQSYDPGWSAYKIDQPSKNPLMERAQLLLPFVFGREVEGQERVNNWENGWVLDKGTDSEASYILVYLPQYLEYIGFIMLFSVSAWLALVYLYHPRS